MNHASDPLLIQICRYKNSFINPFLNFFKRCYEGDLLSPPMGEADQGEYPLDPFAKEEDSCIVILLQFMHIRTPE
jgi:hypothetical protein